ncbi:hypothetical protein Y1Q_0024345 [Alligator mississippiensis]|uniref:Uncharacterized protein n=1 Tax=Alligator mississippiensis TaxID=8496 RepID=A0A151NIN3_ALLMI|nr:hypothetical protein Y1Q_0024345 [Alligator mississippiensis]
MVGLGEWVGVWGSEGAGLSKGWRTIMFLHWLYLGYTQMLRGNDPALQIKDSQAEASIAAPDLTDQAFLCLSTNTADNSTKIYS